MFARCIILRIQVHLMTCNSSAALCQGYICKEALQRSNDHRVQADVGEVHF